MLMENTNYRTQEPVCGKADCVQQWQNMACCFVIMLVVSSWTIV